jgi:hypothetical protein
MEAASVCAPATAQNRPPRSVCVTLLEIMKKYKALLFIPLIVVVGIFFFFYRMGKNDAKKLADFSVAYEKFDQATSAFYKPVLASTSGASPLTDGLERQADEAQAELKTKSSARISSLTKNDAELMRIALEIGDLSGKEVDILKAYKRAVVDKNAAMDPLIKELGDLTSKRQTDYARFLELAGLKD